MFCSPHILFEHVIFQRLVWEFRCPIKVQAAGDNLKDIYWNKSVDQPKPYNVELWMVINLEPSRCS